VIRVLGIIVAVALSSSGAFASEWPGKPVRLVVPFAAGGAADTIGRDALTAAFG
jgi:tripartite-type tricarboxylate transporter receptor subunit TctC